MRSNVRLLDFLIDYWSHYLGAFDLQGDILEIALEDICFIVGLSQQGAPVNLEGTDRGSDLLSVQNYIDTYCTLDTIERGTCIPIVHIRSLPLQVLVSTIVRVAGSSSLHLATRNQMRIVVECLQGALFDWCSGVIPIMKKQPSNCKRGRRKKFGYSSILVAFFFERVPSMSPVVPLPFFSPYQPRLSRWGEIVLRQGGDESVQSVYDDDFYLWWGR